MTHTDRPRLVSIGAVAQALGCSESVLRKWEGQGLIAPPARIGGDGRRVYTEGDIESLRMIAEGRRFRRRRTTEPIGA